VGWQTITSNVGGRANGSLAPAGTAAAGLASGTRPPELLAGLGAQTASRRLMPRPRLPWFKIWCGATRDSKIVTLSDRLFRVWVELLDAASEQKIRGRFDSYAAAAAIVRRKPAEVRQVAAAGLMDESQDGIWMHDWQDWQRWRPEDSLTNNTGMTHESLPNDPGLTTESLAIDSRITTDKHTIDTAPRAKKREGDIDVDVEERDIDVAAAVRLESYARAREESDSPFMPMAKLMAQHRRLIEKERRAAAAAAASTNSSEETDHA
jgi:hypothetical protein